MLRQDSGEVLLQGEFDAAAVAEGQSLFLSAPEPLETVYETPLLLRLSADSLSGEGIAPMIYSGGETEGFALGANGVPLDGMLCFSAEGTDYIWTGLHYWKFASVLGVILALLLFLVWKRYRSGKHSYIINALTALKKYRFLIRQLVSRDFKTKYKRSILGVFWSFLMILA